MANSSQSVVNLTQAASQIKHPWCPGIVAALNGQHVKLAKLKGEFVWHSHADEDELFLVVEGKLTIRLRGEQVSLEAGELYVVPKGVEHQPVAEEEALVLLFEPASTINTGSTESDKRVEDLSWLV